MIKALEKHISEKEIEVIVDKIVAQYRLYHKFMENPKIPVLFAEEYSPHRKKQSLGWAIFSAFLSNSVIGETLKVQYLTDDGGHRRPELENESIKLHILSDTTDFKAKYLQANYLMNCDDFSNEKLYCYIKFKMSKDNLLQISICLPDESGVVIAEEILRTESELRLVA